MSTKKTMRKHFTAAVVLAALTAAFTLSACGSDDADAAGGNAGPVASADTASLTGESNKRIQRPLRHRDIVPLPGVSG